MKNLIIFFKGDYKKKYGNDAFFGISKNVQKGFISFLNQFKNENINIFICRGEDTYLGKNTFNMGFKYINNDFILKKENIKGSFIFNRSNIYFEKGFNNNDLINFCRDKRNIINILSKYSYKSYFIKNKEALKEKMYNFKEKKRKVLKPINGSRGENILITKSNKKISNYSIFPCLLQKFINTSNGIPNIYNNTHDLRITIINGNIVYSMYRVPKKKSYISNINKGGTYKIININLINKNTRKLIKKVDNILKKFSLRFYSIDIGYTKKGIKIFELNSSPGIPEKKTGSKKLHIKLHDLIINSI